mgnify:CR=1 FL=1
MSTSKRVGQKQKSEKVSKRGRVESPAPEIQIREETEEDEVNVDSPSSLSGLDQTSDSNSEREGEEDNNEGVGDDVPGSNPRHRLTVVHRNNLTSGQQGRQLPVDSNDGRDDVIETVRT